MNVNPKALTEIVEGVLPNIPVRVTGIVFEFDDETTFGFERDFDTDGHTWVLNSVDFV